MPTHDYSPSQALELLMLKLRDRDERLADDVQRAIDAGKDVREVQPSFGHRRKARHFRRVVPYSPDEALTIVLRALNAYFVELPMLVESCAEYFKVAALSAAASRDSRVGEEKDLEIELQPETQVLLEGPPTHKMLRATVAEIQQQRDALAALSELLRFDGAE